jgi:DNA-directed RNA polymerase specialized sigma subunit
VRSSRGLLSLFKGSELSGQHVDILWKNYDRSRSDDDRNALLEHFARRIASIARKISDRYPTISFDEARSAGHDRAY